MSAELSLNEWVVLALLVERPAHGFALAKQLEAGTDLGRILTVRRPLVYRALDRLAEAGHIVNQQREPGDGGPTRNLFRAAKMSEAMVDRWLVEPVDHVRDLRVGFLIKLRLSERRGADPHTLVSAQQARLADALEGLLARSSDGDVVDRWRYHNAVAVAAFLDDVSG